MIYQRLFSLRYFTCNSQFKNMHRLFEDAKLAEKYAKFRPVYPSTVTERIVRFLAPPSTIHGTALDVGCGSGQSTFSLQSYFSKVIGTDISEAQIKQANAARQGQQNSSNCHVSFRVSSAESLCFQPDNSIDLVTVAQAIHWINVDQFYGEVNRVLTSQGVLALYGYGNVTLDNEVASEMVHKYYTDIVRPYFDDPRKHVDNHLADFSPLPFKDSCRVDDLTMVKHLRLAEFIGYLTSWSGYNAYCKAHPDNTVLEDLSKSLVAAYRAGSSGCEPSSLPLEDGEVPVIASWPIYILMGRKKES